MNETISDRCGRWVEATLEDWFDLAPVDASFAGLSVHDARLPDLSTDGLAEAARRLADRLGSLPPEAGGGPPAGPTRPEAMPILDAALLADALTVRLWELESRWMVRNPSVHAGEAVFSLASLLLPQHAGERAARFEALSARLRGIPAYLEEAAAQMGPVPDPWVERALVECGAGLTLLREGLPLAGFDDDEGIRIAGSAFEAFEGRLRSGGRGRERAGCGVEGFELLMERGHRLDRGPEEILAYAREEMERTESWTRGRAMELGLSTPHEVAKRLRDLHPVADAYYARFGVIWSEVRALSEERRLLTWPDAPIHFAPRPAWSRAAAPGLYFLFYRSGAVTPRPESHEYMVAPLPEDASPAALDDFLRANNDSVIRLNHVVHHGGIGHHVQNWHAFRSPLRMGRVGAIDCASRIAFFGAGTMAEGWACYATDLVAEAGGLSELEQFAEHVGRIRMCARAVVDVELHLGRMTIDEAAAFYEERAKMPAASARAEAVKNSMFPGAAMMYLIGTDRIHQLRSELMRDLGDRFELRTFHDAFLSWGSIPVQVVAEEMRARARARLPLGAHEPFPSDPTAAP